MPATSTRQIHTCTECKSIRCYISDTTLCLHPKHVRHIANLRRAESCKEFEMRITTSKENEESDLS